MTTRDKMVHKDKIPRKELVGKYVEYLDRDGKRKCGKVVKISGRTISIKRADKVIRRLHPDKNKIFGAYTKKKGRFLPIDWS